MYSKNCQSVQPQALRTPLVLAHEKEILPSDISQCFNSSLIHCMMEQLSKLVTSAQSQLPLLIYKYQLSLKYIVHHKKKIYGSRHA